MAETTGIIRHIFSRGVSLTDAETWYRLFGAAGSTASGVVVTQSNAMQMTAVFACVRVLAETVASLPLIVYKRNPDGSKERATNHYLYSLLHDTPNMAMTSFQWRETLMGHLCTWGNAYSRIVLDGRGRIAGLEPLSPDAMTVKRAEDGSKAYDYQPPGSGKKQTFRDDQIFHVSGMGFDGLQGYSPIAMARQAIGLGLATERYGAAFFGNGANPGGVLEHPAKLSDTAYARLRDSWEARHRGPDNASRVAILEEGMKYTSIGIPPEDAQFLETRRFQVEEIARVFRVPLHMIGDLQRATFSNIEHQAIEFVVHTIRPWLVRWEQAITQQLMTDAERRVYFVEFLVDGLLRGDTQSRYAAYAVGRQWGWLSANDIRNLENMDPIEGGEEYLVPLNMGEAGAPPPEPAQQDSRAQEWRSAPPNIEKRGRSIAAGRLKLARRQARVFEDAAARIVRRERNDVTSQARKLYAGQVGQISPVAAQAEFERWLNEFYGQHAAWTAAQMLPVMRAYAELVSDVVSGELDSGDLSPRVERFVESYADEFGRREAARSLAAILSLVRDTAAESVPDAVQERMDTWLEERPAAIAHEESVRENNAVAVALYAGYGVTRIMSVATGESSCPYCRALDGKVIGIQEYFLMSGQEFQPEGAEAPLTVTHNKRHSPYHGGCDCIQVSGG